MTLLFDVGLIMPAFHCHYAAMLQKEIGYEEVKRNAIKEELQRLRRAEHVILLLENQLKLDEKQAQLDYDCKKEPLSRALRDFEDAKKRSDSIFGFISDVFIRVIKIVSSYFGFDIKTNKEVTDMKLHAFMTLQQSYPPVILQGRPDYKIDAIISLKKQKNHDKMIRVQIQYDDIELKIRSLRKQLIVSELAARSKKDGSSEISKGGSFFEPRIDNLPDLQTIDDRSSNPEQAKFTVS